jgi:hypothetical protein
VLLCLDDSDPDHEGFKESWRQFWAASNLFQLLNACCGITTKGLGSGAYDALLLVQEETSLDVSVQDETWQEALDLTAYPEELGSLIKSGYPTPEIGIDWTNEDNEVIAQFEWLWPDARIGFAEIEPELAQTFTEAGWRIVIDRGIDSMQSLNQWLRDDL